LNVRALVLVAAAFLTACGGNRAAPPGKPFVADRHPSPNLDAGPPDGLPPSVASAVVAEIGSSATGPFLARTKKGGLVAWLETPVQGGARVFAVAVDAYGAPEGESRAVANAPSEAHAVVLRATRDGSRFYAAWSGPLDRGEVLETVAIDAKGSPVASKTVIERTNDDIVWHDLVATPRGMLLVWAERATTGDANIVAAPLGPDGKMTALPTRVAQGAIAWQAVPTPDGVGLALVSRTNGADSAGRLAWLRIDAAGRPIGSPTAITASSTVSGDVDVTVAGGQYVLAWTDRSGDDPSVVIASVNDAGVVRGPVRAIDPIGGETLVALASGAPGVVLAWANASRRATESRRIHLARVTLGDTLATIDGGAIDVRDRPELVATSTGFAMIASATTCAPDYGSLPGSPCTTTVTAPTFFRFDAQLAITQIDPIRVDIDHTVASLAWSLQCGDDRCLALAAMNGSPTAIRTLDLTPRETSFRGFATPPPAAGAPRVAGLTTLAAGQSIGDVAGARIGDTSFVATISASTDESDGAASARNPGSYVVVRVLGPDGTPVAAPSIVTKRALATGGLAMAAAVDPKDGVALAWVARVDGDAQLHVARVNDKGHRTSEAQITTTRGNASDAAIAAVAGGWVVAWVDSRDGNGEVYAARLDRSLNRIGEDRRITKAAGDASDVTLLTQGDKVWIGWADPRDSPNDGLADIWVAALRAKDATRLTEEQRVAATAAHSRSPSLAIVEGAPLVAWIEEAPLGLDASQMQAYGAMTVQLDEHGRPELAPSKLPVAGDGLATNVVLQPVEGATRAYLARSGRGYLEIDALVLGRATPRAYPLLGVEGPSSMDPSMTPIGDTLVYADEGKELGTRRLRRASLIWKL
jgi:hypothetical protein